MFPTHSISFTLFKFKTMKISEKIKPAIKALESFDEMIYYSTFDLRLPNRDGEIEIVQVCINDTYNYFDITIMKKPDEGVRSKVFHEKYVIETDADIDHVTVVAGTKDWSPYIQCEELISDLDTVIALIINSRKAELNGN